MRGPRAGGAPCTSNWTLSGGSHHTSLPFGHEIKMLLKNPFTPKHDIGTALLRTDAFSKSSLWHPLNVLSCAILPLFVSEWVLSLRSIKKGKTFGNMFHIWWYKWELAINDVVLISHVEFHYKASNRRRGRGIQSLGCAWRAYWRL